MFLIVVASMYYAFVFFRDSYVQVDKQAMEQLSERFLESQAEKIDAEWLGVSERLSEVKLEQAQIGKPQLINAEKNMYEVRTAFKGYYIPAAGRKIKQQVKFSATRYVRYHVTSDNRITDITVHQSRKNKI